MLIKQLNNNIVNALWYLAPQIINFLISLFSTRIFTRYLTHYDFSLLGFFSSFEIYLFLPVFTMGFTSNYMAEFYTPKEIDNRQMLSMSIKFLSYLNIATILLFMGLMAVYFYAADVSFPLMPFALLTLVTCYFTVNKMLFLTDCKMNRRGRLYFIISVIYFILSIGLALLFVAVFKWGAIGRMLGPTIASLLVAVIIGFYIKNPVKLDIRQIFKFGGRVMKKFYPSVISSLLIFPILYLDRVILETKGDMEQLGLYNLGVTFSGYLFIIFSTLYQAFEPDVYKNAVAKKYKQVGVLLLVFFIPYALCCIAYSLISKDVTMFLTNDLFTESYKYINVFVWVDFFIIMSYFMGALIITNNLLKQNMYIKIVLAVIVPAIYLCIHSNDFMDYAYIKLGIAFINMILAMSLLLIYRKRLLQPQG